MNLHIQNQNQKNQAGESEKQASSAYLKFNSSNPSDRRDRFAGFDQAQFSHVLIADDDPEVRTQLRRQLSACKCQTTFVASGSAALKAIENSPTIDLVIINWMMPGLSGLFAARTIKQIAPETRVLVMVGEHFLQAIKSTYTTWADGFIEKPTSTLSFKDLLPNLALVRKQRSSNAADRKSNVTIQYDQENTHCKINTSLGA